ncbi:hypothetical protein [Phocaeicola sp.]
MVYDRLFFKSISCDVREIFFQENGLEFNRYDIIVRYLAIKNYYGKNTFGVALYKKMQEARINKEWGEKSIEQFFRLIESYEYKGYDASSQIELDKTLRLMDGSHRCALALYHKKYIMSCKVHPFGANIYYGINWFIEKGFALSEIEILKSTYQELRDSFLVPFSVILWPPVQNYFDDIIACLQHVGKVVEYKDYLYDDYTFAAMARGIYAVDDIAGWKIEKKINAMSSSSPKKIRVALLKLEHPDFRLKSTTNTTLSVTCEKIKKMIRNCYRGNIDGYMHDIIIHIGDNYYQNEYIERLFTAPPIDVAHVLNQLSGILYAITKIDVPYMPDDFPLRYPLNKDIDILCADKEEFVSARDIILASLDVYKMDYSIRVVDKKDETDVIYRSLIRLEQENYLVFQFDISYRTGKTKNGFEIDLVHDRVMRNTFYATSLRFELLIRLCELNEHPNKNHHLEYLNKYKSDISPELCDQYLDFNWRKIIKRIEYENS